MKLYATYSKSPGHKFFYAPLETQFVMKNMLSILNNENLP